MSSTICAFIISWSGHKEKAFAIEQSLAEYVEQLIVIHSDETGGLEVPSPRWRVVPNEWFYGRKFRRSLEEFDGDIMLQITADVTCADWGFLARRCREAFAAIDDLGLWAPNVDHTWWNVSRTEIARVDNSPIRLVTGVDSVVWALSKDVIDRLRGLDYEINNLGWGIEGIAANYCHANNRHVAVDSEVAIIHPPGRGYSRDEAQAQQAVFMRQQTGHELIQGILSNHFMSTRPG